MWNFKDCFMDQILKIPFIRCFIEYLLYYSLMKHMSLFWHVWSCMGMAQATIQQKQFRQVRKCVQTVKKINRFLLLCDINVRIYQSIIHWLVYPMPLYAYHMELMLLWLRKFQQNHVSEIGKLSDYFQGLITILTKIGNDSSV